MEGDIIFTFPRKNPKYSNLNELRKTCIYLNLPYQIQGKKELIDLLSPLYVKWCNDRIQITNDYYVKTSSFSHLKSFIKIEETNYKEVYKLTNYNGKNRYIIKYCKNKKLFIGNERNKKLEMCREAILYIEWLDVYTKCIYLLKHGILLNDIVKHITSLFPLPPSVYTII